MKLVVQRVKRAKVGDAEIDLGLFILLGVKKGDTKEEAETLAVKISKLRVMSDKNDKMNLSVVDAKAEILVVSQFTLYADTSGGNRPSFISAEDPDKAKIIYEFFIEKLRSFNIPVQTGTFGEYMKIEALLDGPVTIVYSD